MLAVSDIDVFEIMNGLLQRYPKDKQPRRYYGINTYFATSPQREHAIVLDTAELFMGVTPSPPRAVVDGTIQWEVVDEYLNTSAKKLPIYSYKRPDPIAKILEQASSNDKHALSALLSNFTPAVRPAIRRKVIEFLLDPRATKFSLPLEMQPKRGRAVEYYRAASEADFSGVKNEVNRLLEGKAKLSDTSFDARYWSRLIEKERKNNAKH